MKTVIHADGTFRCLGIYNVLKACGHDIYLWSPRSKPVFDVFDETNPDLFLGTDEVLLNREVAKCLGEYRRTCRALSTSGVAPAADTILFAPGEKRGAYTSQIVHVGPHKKEYEEYLLPLCRKFQVKIYGDGLWPVAQYLGPVALENIRHLHASSRLSVNLDDAEGIYQILMSGGLPLTSVVAEPFNDGNVLFAKNPREFADVAAEFLKINNTEEYKQRGMQVIRDGNTYWHRTADLLGPAVMETYYATVRF